MIKKAFLTLVMLLVLMPVPAFCNQYKEMSLEEKVKESDLVAIGYVSSLSAAKCAPVSSCATVDFLRVLKGSNPATAIVVFKGDIAELNPQCCVAGRFYLFFLKATKDGLFESANGPFGIYEIPKKPDLKVDEAEPLVP